MGISTRSATIRIYMLSTGLATLAGIVFSIYTQAGYALAGVGVELDAIASVVIGGTLLSGGVGTVLGDAVRGGDPGADSDLHQLRRHAQLMVDEDRHRHPAVYLHRAAARADGAVGKSAECGGDAGGGGRGVADRECSLPAGAGGAGR